MKQRFLVVGLGRFGAALAETLSARGVEVMALDADMGTIDAVKSRVAFAVQLDATDPEALRSVDASACAAAVVTMGEDFETSMLVVAALREAGVKRVIARAASARQARILTVIGADEVLELESEAGHRLGESLASAGKPAGK
jgi:trk/ktr system potassium uptake protein